VSPNFAAGSAVAQRSLAATEQFDASGRPHSKRAGTLIASIRFDSPTGVLDV
jgi:hypothetical protein